MSDIKTLQKLREWSHYYDNVWARSDGEVATIVHNRRFIEPDMKNVGETWRELADEIQAEVAERYMPLPVDADGVPWTQDDDVFIDESGYIHNIRRLAWNPRVKQWYLLDDDNNPSYLANECRHVKDRTVRALLDERGVEYVESHDSFCTRFRFNYCEACCDYLNEIEVMGACVTASKSYLTPEQAIVATLGHATCECVIEDNANESDE